MKATDAIRIIMNRSDTRVVDLARRLEVKDRVITDRLSQSNIGMNNLLEMVEALGCHIEIVSNDSDDRYTIESDEKNKNYYYEVLVQSVDKKGNLIEGYAMYQGKDFIKAVDTFEHEVWGAQKYLVKGKENATVSLKRIDLVKLKALMNTFKETDKREEEFETLNDEQADERDVVEIIESYCSDSDSFTNEIAFFSTLTEVLETY